MTISTPKIILSLILTIFINIAYAQQGGTLKGKVTADNGKYGENISVTLSGSTKGTVTNKNGEYVISSLDAGTYTVGFSGIGYKRFTRVITIKTAETTELNVTIKDDNQDLQVVEVTGRKEKTYKTKSTFIGNKTETDVKDLPQSVSYASKELMADQGAIRVGDVVKNFSGVSQFSTYDDLTIRGFRVNGQSNTQLLNGLRTSTGYWKQPLTNYLERVEVLKGPSSALYGNASPGGVVNRVTKKPLDEDRKTVSVSLGSFNTLRALTDFTGPANKDSTLLYRLNFGYEDANSFRDLQFDKNIIIAPSLSYVVSSKTRLNFDLVYNNSRSRLDRGQSTFANNLYSTPQSLSINTGNDHLNEQTYVVTVSGSHQFTDKLSFNAAYSRTGYSEDLYEHRSANTYAVDNLGNSVPNLVAMQIFSRTRKRYIDNLSAYFNYKETTGIFEHNVVAGYDYGSEKLPVGASQLTANGYRNAANTGSIATYVPKDSLKYLRVNGRPVPNVPSFDLNDVLNSQRMQDDSKAFFSPVSVDPTYYYLNAGYVQDQIKSGKFQALLGVRYEYYTDFANYAKSTQQVEHSKAWLPRFGLVYTANKNINLYGTYVEGYNPQTASTLASPNANPDPSNPFKPLTSNMIEFGAKTSWLNDLLTITTAVYQIKQNNTLLAIGNDQFRQIGKERSKGIEFDVTGRITPNWSVLGSYAYNSAVILESNVPAEIGTQKPNAPKNMANIWTRYNINEGQFKGLGIGAGANYASRRVLSLNLAQTIPEYTLINAALYYNLGKVQLQFNANNLANQKYWVGGFDYLRLFPGTPANYMFTMNYTIR